MIFKITAWVILALLLTATVTICIHYSWWWVVACWPFAGLVSFCLDLIMGNPQHRDGILESRISLLLYLIFGFAMLGDLALSGPTSNTCDDPNCGD